MSSWLEKLVLEKLRMMPPSSPSPALTFDFDQVRKAIAMIEGAIEREQVAATERGNTSVAKAAADPSHSYLNEPVFAPMVSHLWEADMTFPLILRRAMLIAISSHVEHSLRQWCLWLEDRWKSGQKLNSFKKEVREN